MKLYLRYLIFYFLKLFLMIVCALTLMATLLQVTMTLNTQFNSLDFGAFHLAKFTILQVPSILAYTLPISLICAVVYTLHLLHSDNELLILELSGVNKLKIAMPLFVIMVIMMLLSQILCSFIGPLSKKHLLMHREEVQKGVVNSVLKEKTFTKLSSKLMVYIEDRTTEKDLTGIIIHDKNNPNTPATILAEQGTIIDGEDNKVLFKLQNGSRHLLSKGAFQTLYFKSWLFDISEYSKRLLNLDHNIDTKSTYKLFRMRSKSGADFPAKTARELHRRLSWPLLTIALPVLFLFSSLSMENDRDKSTKNILYSLLLALLSTFLYFLFINRIAVWNGFIVLLYLNPVVFSLIGLWLVRRIDEGNARQI